MSLVSVVREGHSAIRFLMYFPKIGIHSLVIRLADARYDLLAYKGGSVRRELD